MNDVQTNAAAPAVAPPPAAAVAVAPVPLTAVPTDAPAADAPRVKRKYTKRAVTAEAPKAKRKYTKRAVKADAPKAKRKYTKRAKTDKVAKEPKVKRIAGAKAQTQVPKAVMKFFKAGAKEQGVRVADVIRDVLISHASRRGVEVEA